MLSRENDVHWFTIRNRFYRHPLLPLQKNRKLATPWYLETFPIPSNDRAIRLQLKTAGEPLQRYSKSHIPTEQVMDTSNAIHNMGDLSIANIGSFPFFIHSNRIHHRPRCRITRILNLFCTRIPVMAWKTLVCGNITSTARSIPASVSPTLHRRPRPPYPSSEQRYATPPLQC